MTGIGRFFNSLLPAKAPPIDKDTFVLWEPCSRSHGEIVPGYTRYLLDLGYRVVVFVTPDRLTEGLFSRFDHPGLTLARLSQRQIRRLMHRPEIRRAAGLLVTTAGKLPHGADQRIDLQAAFGPHPPERLLLVEHDVRAQVEAGCWDPKTITLREINFHGAGSVVVNPHDFGRVARHDKNTPRTIFLMAGAVRSKRRNQNLILDAARALLAEGTTDFQIRLAGKKGSEGVPQDLAGHVVELGRVSFTTLYDEAEASDFILTAFQRDNPDHAFYRTTGSTGSFQLAYGFHTPCIVQRDFATATALNDRNSLLYDDDADVAAVMRRAITMSRDDYATMRDAMADSAAALHQHSLQNLKALIDG